MGLHAGSHGGSAGHVPGARAAPDSWAARRVGKTTAMIDSERLWDPAQARKFSDNVGFARRRQHRSGKDMFV